MLDALANRSNLYPLTGYRQLNFIVRKRLPPKTMVLDIAGITTRKRIVDYRLVPVYKPMQILTDSTILCEWVPISFYERIIFAAFSAKTKNILSRKISWGFMTMK